MVKKPRIVALIPARGGSKSIPRKNIKPLAGVPLIAYSIAAAKEAELVDRIVVSTDDGEIAEVSRAWGAEVPFLRPPELAEDHVRDLPVMEHAVHWLRENGDGPDIVCQVRPTSPFRPRGCLDGAIRTLLSDASADSVRGVTPSGQNPYKMWRIADGAMKPLLASEEHEPYNMPRQELPATYWQTGHIEVLWTRTMEEKRSLTGDRILPYLIDPAYAVDLDNLVQWAFAEHLALEGGLDRVSPVGPGAAGWEDIRLLVCDFDGVMTDDRVLVRQDGRESVFCHRGDGMGVALLKRAGIPVAVLSTEENPVVAARCEKLGIACVQGIGKKGEAVERIASEHGVPLEAVAFVGNDVNDLPAMERAGFSLAVSDAHPEVKKRADRVLSKEGGRGAVREVCDLLLTHKKRT